MPPVSTRSMPPPPNEPPPPNSKFLSKYRPGYNMTAAPNAVAGGPPVIPSGANYYNPALDFSSPNGFGKSTFSKYISFVARRHFFVLLCR